MHENDADCSAVICGSLDNVTSSDGDADLGGGMPSNKEGVEEGARWAVDDGSTKEGTGGVMADTCECISARLEDVEREVSSGAGVILTIGKGGAEGRSSSRLYTF
jgi:hypothetical protein